MTLIELRMVRTSENNFINVTEIAVDILGK